MSLLIVIMLIVFFILVVGLLIFVIFKLKDLEILKSNVERANYEISNSKSMINENSIATLNTIRSVEKDLTRLSGLHDEINRYTERLKDLFESPKHRGKFGEIVLKDLIKSVFPERMWKEQYSIEPGSRVDFAILYNDLIIPIDSKFPRDNYIRFLNEENEDKRKTYWRDFVNDIAINMKKIKEKYVKPELGTTNFALMFVPSESIYYDIITLDDNEKNNSIYKMSMSNNVIIVSPNTFYMFLNVLLMGIQNIEIGKRIKIIREKLSGIKRDFNNFSNKIEDMGTSLSKINESYRLSKTHFDRFKNKVDDLFTTTEEED